MGLVFVHLFICLSLFWPMINNSITVCLIWLSKVPKKHIDEPDPTVPITLGSLDPLVEKIDIKKII